MSIIVASLPEDFDAFRILAQLYLEYLGEDLAFQGVDKELEQPQNGCHAQPRGCVLLATDGSATCPQQPLPGAQRADICGGVALRPLDRHELEGAAPNERVCEIKRLFVRPEQRGQGIAKRLMAEVLQQARARGYSWVVLDTLERLSEANGLYESFGFERCAPYYHNPLEGVVYWRLRLAR